jgi:amidase
VCTPSESPGDVDLRKLRVSLHTDNGIMAPTAETARTIRAAAKALESAGSRLVEARPKSVEKSFDLAMRIYFEDAGAALRRLPRRAGTTEHMLGNIADSPPATAEELDALFVELDTLRSDMLSIFESHDVVPGPVNAAPAVPHGSVEAADALPSFSYTTTYDMTGWPGVVVFGGTSPEGLPIGVQILAPRPREDVALAMAKHVESELGGFRSPSICRALFCILRAMALCFNA